MQGKHSCHSTQGSTGGRQLASKGSGQGSALGLLAKAATQTHSSSSGHSCCPQHALAALGSTHVIHPAPANLGTWRVGGCTCCRGAPGYDCRHSICEDGVWQHIAWAPHTGHLGSQGPRGDAWAGLFPHGGDRLGCRHAVQQGPHPPWLVLGLDTQGLACRQPPHKAIGHTDHWPGVAAEGGKGKGAATRHSRRSRRRRSSHGGEQRHTQPGGMPGPEPVPRPHLGTTRTPGLERL